MCTPKRRHHGFGVRVLGVVAVLGPHGAIAVFFLIEFLGVFGHFGVHRSGLIGVDIDIAVHQLDVGRRVLVLLILRV